MNSSLKTFEVYISETFRGYVEVRAVDEETARQIAGDMLFNRDICPTIDFDSETVIEASESQEAK
jgi:hypothetical protein